MVQDLGCSGSEAGSYSMLSQTSAPLNSRLESNKDKEEDFGPCPKLEMGAEAASARRQRERVLY